MPESRVRARSPWFVQHVVNPMMLLTGALPVLSFRGRRSGKLFRTPVNVLELNLALDAMGRIAWPFRSAGPLKDADRETLIRGWRHLMVEGPQPRPLVKLDEQSDVKVEELLAVLGKTGITPKARAAGYAETERAGLFSTLDEAAEPCR